jgi:hypothetical protein
MKKKMYALTYCYGGTDNTNQFATTIAVSTDIKKLKAEMEKCVAEDCEIDEDDVWSDDKNYIVYSKYDTEVTLQHRENTNLYTTYNIHSVDYLG